MTSGYTVTRERGGDVKLLRANKLVEIATDEFSKELEALWRPPEIQPELYGAPKLEYPPALLEIARTAGVLELVDRSSTTSRTTTVTWALSRYELEERLERIVAASQINDRIAVPGLLSEQTPREWIRNAHAWPATEHSGWAAGRDGVSDALRTFHVASTRASSQMTHNTSLG